MQLKRQQQYGAAMTAFRHFLQDNPSHARAHYHLGICYQKFNEKGQPPLVLQALCLSLDLVLPYQSYAQKRVHHVFFVTLKQCINDDILVGLAKKAQLIYQQYQRGLQLDLLTANQQLSWIFTKFNLLVPHGFTQLAFEYLAQGFALMPTAALFNKTIRIGFNPPPLSPK